MALLAESLVEEWLNRDGFFTIRGVKHGVGEMDLLAVRPQDDGSVVGWHVEVQASFRPIGYIAKTAPQVAAEPRQSRSIARGRTPDEVEVCAREWVRAKFLDPKKAQIRERLWPGIQWSFHLVHAVVREQRELDAFAAAGVRLHPLHDLLFSLSRRSNGSFSGSAGGDLAEIIGYYKSAHEDPTT